MVNDSSSLRVTSEFGELSRLCVHFRERTWTTCFLGNFPILRVSLGKEDGSLYFAQCSKKDKDSVTKTCIFRMSSEKGWFLNDVCEAFWHLATGCVWLFNFCRGSPLQLTALLAPLCISGSKGCVVSSNIAPATATASVVSNKSFALAYKGRIWVRADQVMVLCPLHGGSEFFVESFFGLVLL